MTTYDNTNRGALFKNTDKKAENHPDYKGNINVDGKEYWLSSWIKTSKDGAKFMSLSCQPKEAKQDKPVAKKAQGFDDPDDQIPF